MRFENVLGQNQDYSKRVTCSALLTLTKTKSQCLLARNKVLWITLVKSSNEADIVLSERAAFVG